MSALIPQALGNTHLEDVVALHWRFAIAERDSKPYEGVSVVKTVYIAAGPKQPQIRQWRPWCITSWEKVCGWRKFITFTSEKGHKCGEAKQLGRILCDPWHFVACQRTELACPGLQQPYPCVLNPLNRKNDTDSPAGLMRKEVVLNLSYHFFAFTC